MESCRIERESKLGAEIFHLAGTFNAEAAVKLRESLLAYGDRPVVLDFSRVGHFLDLAVPILVHGIWHNSWELRGLARHHARVFRCFGVRVHHDEVVPYWQPEVLAG
jgi:hypothetical protein